MLPTKLTSCKMSEKSVGPAIIYVGSINFARVLLSIEREHIVMFDGNIMDSNAIFIFYQKK